MPRKVSSLFILKLFFFILYFIVNIKSLQSELLVKTILLEQAENKYEQSKANIESIKIKCHDLKHQIRMFTKNNTINNENVKALIKLLTAKM